MNLYALGDGQEGVLGECRALSKSHILHGL